MKKSLIVVIFLLGLGAAALVFLRHSHSSDGREAETDATLHKATSAEKGGGTRPMTIAYSDQRVLLNPRLIQEVTENSEEPRDARPLDAEARAPSYQHLAVTGPRDEKHEQEVLSKLRDAFSGRVGFSVGEVACNAEFCRAEVVGSAGGDFRADIKQATKTVMGSVAPRGLKYCLGVKDGTSTKTSCHFGRDDSWTAPNPAELQR